MANHSKQTVLAIYSLASILSLTTASSLRAAEPTESNQTRTISDQNGDGWDDLWVYMFGRWVDLKDPNRDSNEDGVSDFQCMLAFRDPMSDFHWKYGVQGAGLPSASELKEADAATIARREATWAETKQRLAPWTNQRVRLSDGKLATLAQSQDEKRARLTGLAERIRDQYAAADARVQAFRAEHPDFFDTRSPRDKHRIVDVFDGLPVSVGGLGVQTTSYLGIYYLWPQMNKPDGLTGAGTGIAMWDLGAVRSTHEQFIVPNTSLSRIQNIGVIANDDHATAVASVLAGGGDPSFTYPSTLLQTPLITYQRENTRGISYDATVFVHDFTFDKVDFPNFNPTQVDVFGNQVLVGLSNHSYGRRCGWEELPGQTPQWIWYGTPSISQVEDWKFGFYLGGVCDVWDELVYLKQTVLPVFPAGDDNLEGPSPNTPHIVNGSPNIVTTSRNKDGEHLNIPFNYFDTIIPEGCSKNVLTVSSASSENRNVGPTDDGRIKPDLEVGAEDYVATIDSNSSYGEVEGSSFAVASVTSAVNLLAARYYELHGTDFPLLASTLKVLAIGSNYGLNGPDFWDGWGGLQLIFTLDTINADGSVENILQHPFIKETQLEDQSEIIFPIKHDPFNVTKVMVVWTDPPGTQSSPSLDSNTGGGFNNKKLINDIDIKIIGPNGSEYFPWVLGTGDLEGSPKTLGNNITDNIEQVCIWETEPAGVYTVKITHKKTKPGNAIRHLLDEQGNTAPQPLSIYIQKNQLNNEPPLRIPFQIVGWDRVGPTQFMLSFSSVVGGIYQIERSTNLTDWTVDPGEILPNSILTTATVNTNAGTANEYFRVRQIR